MEINPSLTVNLDYLHQALHMDINKDVNLRRFQTLGVEATILFLEGMASTDQLQRFVLEPCLHHTLPPKEGVTVLQAVLANVLEASAINLDHSMDAAIDGLFDGKAILLLDTVNVAIMLDVRGFVKRAISQPVTEAVVIGPYEGFNESLRDNITLIRRMLHSPNLISELDKIGDQTAVNICILYMNGIAPAETVNEVRRRLKGVRTDYVSSIGMLEQLIEDEPLALLPQLCTTERPDSAVSFLMEGQVIVVMDGFPQVLALPINFLHLYHAPDDTSLRWQYGIFLRLIRTLGTFCGLFLPAIFIALTMYHQEAMPITLLTSVIESQSLVPLSLLAEAFLMLMMFNLINEASARVPGIGGSSLGIVSGLILGQAAVDANLINPLLIIVIAISGLGSYAVPDYSLSLAFRIIQLVFLAAAGLGGFYGMLIAFVICICGLCGMTSLGMPFMAPMSPRRPRNPDILLRWPIWRQRLRTYFSNPSNMLRTKGPMRGWVTPGARTKEEP